MCPSALSVLFWAAEEVTDICSLLSEARVFGPTPLLPAACVLRDSKAALFVDLPSEVEGEDSGWGCMQGPGGSGGMWGGKKACV